MNEMEKQFVLAGVFEPKKTEILERKMLTERLSLIELLKDSGFDCRAVNEKWPRDFFVFSNEKIHFRNENGNYSDRGYLYFFPDFTLAGSGISKNENGEEDSAEKRFAKLNSLYNNEIRIMPSPNLNLNSELREHIDMVMLPIPEKQIVFVDYEYYREYTADVCEFAEAKSLKLALVHDDY